MRMPSLALTVVVISVACSGTEPGRVAVAGQVWRGPIFPVCQPGVPCVAPVEGNFSVSAGGRRVTGFRTAADGRFSIRLDPGTYRVQWLDDPLGGQSQELAVGEAGATDVALHFDTGIR